MIGITQRAKDELKRMLTDNTDNYQAGLRLIDRGEGKLGLGMDIEMPGDHVVEHEGLKVLLVNEQLAELLSGITIDVEETKEGTELVLIRD